MLRSVLLKTVRDQRWPVLAWGLGLVLLLLVTAAGWVKAYPDEASRQRFAAQLSGGLSFAQALYGEPRAVDQLGGWMAWRSLNIYPLLLGIFLVISATGETRGAEERGELEVVLVAARGRPRTFVEQAGGLALALAAVCVLLWLGLLLCGPATGEAGLNPARAALAVLNVWLVTALFGAVALLAAQFCRTRRSAALLAGALLVAAHLWNNLGLVADVLSGWRRLSPLFLYSRSSPLADGHVDIAALVALAVLTVACTALAGWLFARRDSGAVARLPLPRALTRAADPASGLGRSTLLLRGVLGRGLQTALGAALVWGIGLGAYAVLFAAVTPSVRDALKEDTRIQDVLDRLARGGVSTDASFLAAALFSFLPALVALYAVTLPIGWAGEERGGRLELELTCPLPRRRYFLERVAAALLALAIALALAGSAFLFASRLAGLDLNWSKAVAAILLLMLLGGVIVIFGFALAAWRPAVVTPVLAAVVVVSFFLDILAPLFDAPAALRDLSIFHLYGQPLIEGVRWGGTLALLGLLALFALAGSALFDRRDIAR